MTFTVAKVKPGHQADAPGVEEEGGGTPIYWLYGYVPLERVFRLERVLSHFVWKGYLAGKGI